MLKSYLFAFLVILCSFVATEARGQSSPKPSGASETIITRMELELQAAIKRFEAANAKFRSSTTTAALIDNGHQIDLMVLEIAIVKRVEEKAKKLGIKSVTELREKMERIVSLKVKKLYSDAAAIKTKADFENAMMYLRI